MKTLLKIVFGLLILNSLAACSANYQMASTIPNDDIYFSSGGERQAENRNRTLSNSDNTSGNQVLDNYVTDRKRSNANKDPYLDRGDGVTGNSSAMTNNNPFWNNPTMGFGGMGMCNAGFWGARRYMLYDPFMPPYFAMTSPWSMGMPMGMHPRQAGWSMGIGFGFNDPWMGNSQFGFNDPWMGGGFGNSWMGGGFGNPWMGGGFGNPWMGGGFYDPRFNGGWGSGSIYNSNGKRLDNAVNRSDFTGRSDSRGSTGRRGDNSGNGFGIPSNGTADVMPIGRTAITPDVRRGGVRSINAEPATRVREQRQPSTVIEQPRVSEPRVREQRQQAPRLQEQREPRIQQPIIREPRQQQPIRDAAPSRDFSPSRGGFPSAPSAPSAPASPAGRGGGRSPR